MLVDSEIYQTVLQELKSLDSLRESLREYETYQASLQTKVETMERKIDHYQMELAALQNELSTNEDEYQKELMMYHLRLKQLKRLTRQLPRKQRVVIKRELFLRPPEKTMFYVMPAIVAVGIALGLIVSK